MRSAARAAATSSRRRSHHVVSVIRFTSLIPSLSTTCQGRKRISATDHSQVGVKRCCCPAYSVYPLAHSETACMPGHEGQGFAASP